MKSLILPWPLEHEILAQSAEKKGLLGAHCVLQADGEGRRFSSVQVRPISSVLQEGSKTFPASQVAVFHHSVTATVPADPCAPGSQHREWQALEQTSSLGCVEGNSTTLLTQA